MLIAISSPAMNQRGPAYVEQALEALHQFNPGGRRVRLFFAPHASTVQLFCQFPHKIPPSLEHQLGALYPDCTIRRLPQDALAAPTHSQPWKATLRLHPDVFPIRRYTQFEDPLNRNAADPITGLLAPLEPVKNSRLRPMIEIVIRPAQSRRCGRARRTIARLAQPFFRAHPRLAHLYADAVTSRRLPTRLVGRILGACVGHSPGAQVQRELTTTSSRIHDREDNLQAAGDKLGRHLFETHILLTVHATPDAAAEAKRKIREMAAAFGHFTMPRLATFRVGRIRRGPRPRLGRTFLMSSEEIATLWHPPTSTVRAPKMEITLSRQLEPPAVLPSGGSEPGVATLGRVLFRRRRELFGVRLDDRRRHSAIIGKTGMGKSTLLHNLIASDIAAGQAVGLIDPHGDLAEAVLDCIPKRRTNHVVLFDVGDRDHPLAFNPLDSRLPEQRALVASGIVSAFKKLYGESWGPRLEHILRNALLALLENPGTSLLSLVRLLTDARFRNEAVSRLQDPVVRSFWQNEFAKWNPNFRAEAIAPIQNKIGQFFSHPILRPILSQPRNKVDFRRIMDDGQILIVNLSKGRIGEDASTLLGSLLVTSLQLAAMSRADVPEDHRPDFFLYVDEFQNFATESFATILSEARKYRLNLTLANQYLAQMDEQTLEAVFGNVGSLLCFQVGARDAEGLAEQLGGDLTPQDLMALPKYTAYIRLLIDGMPSRPFSMQTLPPRVRRNPARSEIIRRTSRHRYTRPINQVERQIEQTIGRP